ncbi:MAG: type I DNA topoisomerase, partial [Patescibacteria group bacterium]
MTAKPINLVIVESPTKAKTISKFLGPEYSVESSYGHVRDLPKSKLGIDIEKDFEPQYIIPVKARKNVSALKKLATKASEVVLATDEDREGEAIAWHLIQALGLDEPRTENREPRTVRRIVFHEITQSAIEEALKNPRSIDAHLVDAQQARRVLDRLVGYKLSPFLWKKIMRGLSAGRVQSVALRLIVEREEEIRKFKPEEYWTIRGIFKKEGKEPNFEATLTKIGEKALEKMGIKTGDDAKKIAADLETAEFAVDSVQKKEARRNPLPPFVTSTLQQEANKRLRMSAKQTMRFAQQLYEKGFITYIRTDSVNLSKESLATARNLIESKFGKNYLLPEPRYFKTKSRLAQEAHEAIRPTNPSLAPEKVSVEEPGARKLYDLIWRRFIASQLPQAVFDAT